MLDDYKRASDPRLSAAENLRTQRDYDQTHAPPLPVVLGLLAVSMVVFGLLAALY